MVKRTTDSWFSDDGLLASMTCIPVSHRMTAMSSLQRLLRGSTDEMMAKHIELLFTCAKIVFKDMYENPFWNKAYNVLA